MASRAFLLFALFTVAAVGATHASARPRFDAPIVGPPIEVEPDPPYGNGGGTAPAIAWNGSEYLVVFRNGVAGKVAVFGARVGANGQLRDNTALRVSDASPTDVSAGPFVTWDGSRYLVLYQRANVWYGARLDGNGQRLDPTDAALPGIGQFPRAMLWGGDRSLVLWETSAGGAIYGSLIDARGTPTDAAPTLLYASTTYPSAQSAAWTGDRFLVTMSEHANVLGVRMTAAGVVQDSPPLVLASVPAGDFASTPRVAMGAGGGMLAWTSTSDHRIRGVQLAPGGTPTGSPFMIDPTARSAASLDALVWDGARYVVAWRDPDASNYVAGISTSGVVTPREHLPEVYGGAPVLLAAGQNVYALCDTGYRGLLGTRGILGTRLDATLSEVDTPPINVVTAQSGQAEPVLGSTGHGYLAVWRSVALGGLWISALGSDGAPVNARGIEVPTSHDDAAVASSGVDYLVAYRGYTLVGGASSQLQAVHVSESGAIGETLTLLPQSTVNVQVAWGGGRYLVGYGLGQGVFVEGTSVSAPRAIVPESQLSAFAIASDGHKFVVAWIGTGELRVATMDATGNFGATRDVMGAQTLVSLAWGGDRYFLAASDGAQVNAMLLDAAGAPVDAFPLGAASAVTSIAWDGSVFLVTLGSVSGAPRVVSVPPHSPASRATIAAYDTADRSPLVASRGHGESLLASVRSNPLRGVDRVFARRLTLPLGAASACASDAECASGFCVDSVCCDSACGAGRTDDCLACSVAAGSAADGTCGPVSPAVVPSCALAPPADAGPSPDASGGPKNDDTGVPPAASSGCACGVAPFDANGCTGGAGLVLVLGLVLARRSSREAARR